MSTHYSAGRRRPLAVYLALPKTGLPGAAMALILLLAGCQAIQPAPSDAAAAPTVAATAAPATEVAAPTPEPEPATPAASAVITLTAVMTQTPAMAGVAALPAPAHLTIAAIGLDVPVQAMGWEVVRNAEGATTRWVLPEGAAGWHVDSARAGEAGNTILSGRQLGGGVFARLALGEAAPGMEVELSDTAGTRFIYSVTEVSDPLPIRGAGEAENALIEGYLQPSAAARLTLITGWPDFTTTHRIFVVAEFVRELP